MLFSAFRKRLAFLAPALLSVSVLIAACGSEPATLVGVERQPEPVVGNVSLPLAGSGEDLPFVAPADELLLVYFGFTFCPDICPTTLADLSFALSELGEGAERVEVVMATIDPARDSDEIVTGYVQSFIPEARAVRTDDQELLRTATRAFGADYSVVRGDDGQPEVGHTTSLYVVDDQGNLVLTWLFGTSGRDIANDLDILLDRA